MAKSERIERRAFIYAGLGAAVAVAGGVAVYFATLPPRVQEKVVEKPVEKTVVQTAVQTVEKPVEKVVEKTLVTTVAGTPTTIIQTVEKPVERTIERPATPKRGGILRIGLGAGSKNLDPQVTTLGTSQNVLETALEKLVVLNERLEPVAVLAEKWQVSEDAKTFTFFLRRNVKWHNGKDFTAEDVKFTLERVKKFPTAGGLFPGLDTIEAIDSYTVRATFTTPYVAMFSALSSPFASIVPKLSEEELRAAGMTREQFEKDGFANILIGTGPFRLVERRLDELEKLEKNRAYWGETQGGDKLPFLDGIHFIPKTDATVRKLDFDSKATDIATLLLDKDFALYKKNPAVNTFSTRNLFITIVFNNSRPPFNDARVRRAVSHAIDKEEINQLVIQGNGEVATSVLPSNNVFHSPNPIPFDLEKAKKLMAEAGFPKGFDAPIACPFYPLDPLSDAVKVVQAQLKKIGIDITLKSTEIGVFISEYITKGDMQMNMQLFGLRGPDPQIGLRRYYRNDWLIFYENPALQKLFEAAAGEVNFEKRKKIYAEVQKIAMEEVPFIPTVFFGANVASHNHVKGWSGYAPGSITDLQVKRVWLDKT